MNTINISLFGATDDTNNLGVSALFYSTLQSLFSYSASDIKLTCFDNGWGVRNDQLNINGSTYPFRKLGGRDSKRIYRYDSLTNIRFCTKHGFTRNPASKALLESNAILDISGGDSFSDLYGMKRFNSIVLPKLIAIENKIPLILLPQTYGPFSSSKTLEIAKYIVSNAKMCFARDERSFDYLKDLLGSNYNPEQHISGVDMAFALNISKPTDLDPDLEKWINTNSSLIGFNISGLIYFAPDQAKNQYGFRANYKDSVLGFINRILDNTDRKVLLIPHVGSYSAKSLYENDHAAADEIFKLIDTKYQDRIRVLKGAFDSSQIKYVISKLDWFCGTRMHSTIAALSSGVPAATIAYSDKAKGVFESCGQGDHVVDPRHLETQDVINDVYKSWEMRDKARMTLKQYLPVIQNRLDEQLKLVINACK